MLALQFKFSPNSCLKNIKVLQRELCLDSLSLLDEFMVHPFNVRKKPNISLLLVMLLLPSVLDAADSFSEECCLVSGSWPQTQLLLPVRKNIRSDTEVDIYLWKLSE